MFKRSLLFLLLLSGAIPAFGEIQLNGALRNDLIFTYGTNDSVLYNYILENKLILQRKADTWRFYADIRAFAYVGTLTNFYGPLRLDIMRAFGRVYTSAGDITIGKQYVSYGNAGLFNPFEMDKNVNLSDVSYDKQGLLGVAWDYVLSDLAGGTIYVRPEAALSNSGAGFGFKFNAGSFDIGLVYNRKGWNQNLAGLSLKGDLGLGINAAWAYHINDLGQDPFHEVSAGLDYSFFAGKLLLNIMAYYCDKGAAALSEYVPFVRDDRFFQAHTYMSSTISVIPSEWLRFSVDNFYNLVDGSMILLPSATFTLANGFTLSSLVSVLTGRGDSEFSMDRSGPVSLLLRAEFKL